jgi:hypothetical protein
MGLCNRLFSDFQRNSVPEQLFLFADANLESASVLCARLRTEANHATYAHGAVIMSLTFHSVELFLKAAILRKDSKEKCNGHDLDRLKNQYADLYPEPNYDFDILFSRQAPDTRDLDPQISKELAHAFRLSKEKAKEVPTDQLHRYPTNKNGMPWAAVLGFEPNSFFCEIQRLKNDFVRIRGLLQDG